MASNVQREVTILVRYQILKDFKQYRAGSIILLVRNDQGTEYYVTLRANKHHSCTCIGHVKFSEVCYHINHCRDTENARYEVCKAAAAALLAEVEQICIEVETEQVAPSVVVPVKRSVETATLSSNQGFSFMRKAS